MICTYGIRPAQPPKTARDWEPCVHRSQLHSQEFCWFCSYLLSLTEFCSYLLSLTELDRPLFCQRRQRHDTFLRLAPFSVSFRRGSFCRAGVSSPHFRDGIFAGQASNSAQTRV